MAEHCFEFACWCWWGGCHL